MTRVTFKKQIFPDINLPSALHCDLVSVVDFDPTSEIANTVEIRVHVLEALSACLNLRANRARVGVAVSARQGDINDVSISVS
jgi:hypothetical protein